MLLAREAEQVASLGRGRIDVLKQRKQLPFDPRAVEPQAFSPLHAFLLNCQGELVDQFGLNVRQAADIVVAIPLAERWEALIHGDLWLAVVALDLSAKTAVTKDWKTLPLTVTRNELLSLVKNLDQVLKESEQKAVAAGASRKTLPWRRAKAKRIWPLHLTGILNEMLTRAEEHDIPLPALTDRAGWWGQL